jgi:hypothetical protein
MSQMELLKKGDLVRINTSGNFFHGMVGIYVGNKSINSDYSNWDFINLVCVRFPQLSHAEMRYMISYLSEPRNLIGYFYASELEKIE